jgi:hypothetical protein
MIVSAIYNTVPRDGSPIEPEMFLPSDLLYDFEVQKAEPQIVTGEELRKILGYD